jgi:tetratricopeptide (TPR) repeat protein
LLSFAALGIGVGGYMGMRVLGIGPVGTLVASGVLESQGTLVLADFENRTADSTLGPSVTEALRVDLAQSPVIRLFDPSAIASALERMNRDPNAPLDGALALDLAEREGAQAVVSGEISPVGQGFVVSAQLVATADGAVLLALRETADDDSEIIQAIDQLSARLRERIGESLRTIRANEPLERVTTGSLDAFRRYSQALRADAEGDVGRTITLLEEAISRDSSFAMAYRKLAAMLNNAGASQSQINEAATKAYEYRHRLPEVEAYLATASYYYNVVLDRSREIDAYRSALELDPENLTALNNLALALNNDREWEEAETFARRAMDLADFWQFYGNALTAQAGMGNFTEVEATVERLKATLSNSPQSLRLEAWAASAQRDYERAEQLVQSIEVSERNPFWRSWTTFTQFTMDQARGQLERAERQIQENMTVSNELNQPGSYVGAAINLAFMNSDYRGDTAAAIRTVEAALERNPLPTMPVSDRPYPALAHFYARLERLDEAKRVLTEYRSEVDETVRSGDPFRHAAAAAIALAEGRVEDAITGYRAAYEEAGCSTCWLFDLARAHERAGHVDSALAVYGSAVSTTGLYRVYEEYSTLAPTYKRLGELYEEREDREQAVDYYNRFVELWQDSDPELQPVVEEVRGRIARLVGEPGG